MNEIEKPAGIDIAKISAIEIKTAADLETGNAILKNCVRLRTDFAAQIKPIKQKIDEYKKNILDYEKSEIAKVEKIEKEQERNINIFKSEILEIRKNIQTIYNDSIRNMNTILAEVKTGFSKLQNDLEKSKITNKKERKKEPDKIEIHIPAQVPVQEIKFKDKEIKINEKTVYEIADEKEVIQWALKNNPGILKIQVMVSEFNKLPETIKSNIPGVIQKTKI